VTFTFTLQFPKLQAPMINYEKPESEFLPSSIVSALIGLSVLIIHQWKVALRLSHNLRRDREIPNTQKPNGHESRTDGRTDNKYEIPRSTQKYSRPWSAATFKMLDSYRMMLLWSRTATD
jgi:hypothetical protein